MKSTWRTRGLADERGTILPLVAVALVVIFGIAAWAVDLANYYQVRQQAQSAADAAALAGAYDLPNSTTTATTDATSYASQDLSGATTTVVVPYNGSSTTIKVTVSKSVNSIFASLFGIDAETVSASAVASAASGDSSSAFFAMDTTCGSSNGIQVSGSNLTFNGAVHSNGSFGDTASGNDFGGGASYGGPNNCADNVSGNNTKWGGGSGPTVDNNKEPWPFDPRSNLPACTYSATSFNWSTSNITIPSGVYCATSKISITGSNVTGNVTFIAPNFDLSGSNLSLTPYWDGLFIYDSGTQPLQLSGSDLNEATVFAPNTSIDLTGSSAVNTGFVEALDINVSGSNWTFNGDGPPLASTSGISLTG